MSLTVRAWPVWLEEPAGGGPMPNGHRDSYRIASNTSPSPSHTSDSEGTWLQQKKNGIGALCALLPPGGYGSARTAGGGGSERSCLNYDCCRPVCSLCLRPLLNFYDSATFLSLQLFTGPLCLIQNLKQHVTQSDGPK